VGLDVQQANQPQGGAIPSLRPLAPSHPNDRLPSSACFFRLQFTLTKHTGVSSTRGLRARRSLVSPNTPKNVVIFDGICFL